MVLLCIAEYIEWFSRCIVVYGFALYCSGLKFLVWLAYFLDIILLIQIQWYSGVFAWIGVLSIPFVFYTMECFSVVWMAWFGLLYGYIISLFYSLHG